MQSQSMLLRSSSAPIPSSLLPHSPKDSSSPDHPEMVLHLPRTRSFASPRQNFADTDHHHHSSPSKSERKNCIPRSNILKNQHSSGIKMKESDEQETHKKEERPSIRELFSSSGLDKKVMEEDNEEDGGVGRKKSSKLQTLVMGGGMGKDGGRKCGGHGSGWWESYEGNGHGRDRTDAYYQSMIEANPNNALLLGNYAKFLKEVRGDYTKAEEYLERAILANPGDATILSLYADVIWQTQKNVDRAEGYFDQAVKTAPDDCYVLASYAKFLWDVEEDDEDKDSQEHKAVESNEYAANNIFEGTNGHPHLNAASQSYLTVTE